MRVELETLALRTAVASATHRTLRTASALLERMDMLADRPSEWLRLNNRFHVTLYGPGRRRHLLRTIQTLRHATEPYLRLYLMALGRFEVSQRQHRRILQAYARGDATGAEEALREHLSDTMRELLRALGGAYDRMPVRP
jgi:DNA-binding GntR family transcriptional regulator